MTPQAISMLGSIGISGANALSQHFTNQHNERLVGIQNRMNIEQWYRENAYNDPSAVMARLRRAGLNPALIYGNGADTTAATSPMLQASQDIAPQMTGESVAQLQLLQTQAELNKANAALKASEKNKVETEIDWLKGQIKVGESVVVYNNALTDLTKEQQNNLVAQTNLLVKRLDEVDANIAQMQANVRLLDERAKTELTVRSVNEATTAKIKKETGWIDRQAELYQELVAAQISGLQAQTILDVAKSSLTLEQIDEVQQETEHLRIANNKASFEYEQDKKYDDLERSMRLAQIGTECVDNVTHAYSNLSGNKKGSRVGVRTAVAVGRALTQ